jgi:hypothetical protein
LGITKKGERQILLDFVSKLKKAEDEEQNENEFLRDQVLLLQQENKFLRDELVSQKNRN